MTRRLPLITVILGLATAAALALLLYLPEVRAAYPDGGGPQALTRFQLADSSTALAEVFGDPLNPVVTAAMTAANSWDLYLFIPVYGLFLLAGVATIGRGGSVGLRRLAMALTLAGFAGDVIETTTQLRMTADLAAAPPLLGWLAVGAWAKFFGLAAGAFGCSVLCLRLRPRQWGVALAGLSPLPVAILSFVDPDRFAPYMTSTTAGFWLALVIAAIQIVYSDARRTSAARAQNPLRGHEVTL